MGVWARSCVCARPCVCVCACAWVCGPVRVRVRAPVRVCVGTFVCVLYIQRAGDHRAEPGCQRGVHCTLRDRTRGSGGAVCKCGGVCPWNGVVQMGWEGGGGQMSGSHDGSLLRQLPHHVLAPLVPARTHMRVNGGANAPPPPRTTHLTAAMSPSTASGLSSRHCELASAVHTHVVSSRLSMNAAAENVSPWRRRGAV